MSTDPTNLVLISSHFTPSHTKPGNVAFPQKGADANVTHLLRNLPGDFILTNMTDDSLCFVACGKYVFLHPNSLIVVQVGLEWLFHEQNHTTAADWDPEKIYVDVASGFDDVKSSDLIRITCSNCR